MKATLEIPDELYRRVKARSAMEGRPVRAVAVDLFQKWLDEKPVVVPTKPKTVADLDLEKMPWLKIARKYVKEDQNHDMEAIRKAAQAAWGAEAGKKGL
jgi:predicted transcriptional regulator YdeE